jgi:beta-lactamase regulating signal transducer with metallopeptidase domain
MTATLLGLYLKLNLLLAVTCLLWLATKRLAVWLRFDVSHARQLTVARLLFLGVLTTVPLALFGTSSWLGGFAKPLFIDEFNVIANLDNTLSRPYLIAETTLIPAVILAALLLGGLLVQLGRLAQQVQKLRRIVTDSTEAKCIGGIHLLFSPAVSTPFSTRALGKKHVVLPYQLLDSPRNLRLAVKHELQHMRNHDLEWVILLEAASVLFFWNPAMWLWHNEFDCLQEFACDEALVNERHVSSHAYGSCLLEVASASTGDTLIASSNMVPKFSFWQNHHSQLKRRILMLANRGTKKHTALKTLCYALLASLGMTQAALVVFAADNDPPSDAIPLVRINPTTLRPRSSKAWKAGCTWNSRLPKPAPWPILSFSTMP